MSRWQQRRVMAQETHVSAAYGDKVISALELIQSARIWRVWSTLYVHMSKDQRRGGMWYQKNAW